MGKTKEKGPAWLPLGQAAKRLGVHPTTLRRWAENGDFPVMVTPGGHRRFAETDLERFANDRSRPLGHSTIPEGWQDWVLNKLQASLVAQGSQSTTRFEIIGSEGARETFLELLSIIPSPPTPSDDYDVVRVKASKFCAGFASELIDRGASLTELIVITQFLRSDLPMTVMSHPELSLLPPEVEQTLQEYLVAIVDGIQLAISQSWEGKTPTSFGARSEARRYGRPTKNRL